jgi:hypothetical protein
MWFRSLADALPLPRTRAAIRRTACHPALEVLDDRWLPSFLPPASYPVGTNPQAMVTADLNGDGKLDLVVANAGSDNRVSVLLGNGDGTFKPAVNYAVGAGPVSLAVGDFNGDGKLDVVTANYADNTASVLLGNGDGTFQPARSYAVGSRPDAVAVGNFDGNLDIVTANADGGVSELPGHDLATGVAVGDPEHGGEALVQAPIVGLVAALL